MGGVAEWLKRTLNSSKWLWPQKWPESVVIDDNDDDNDEDDNDYNDNNDEDDNAVAPKVIWISCDRRRQGRYW